MHDDERRPVRGGVDPVEVELGGGVGGGPLELERLDLPERPVVLERHEVEHRLPGVGEPRPVLRDDRVVDERAVLRRRQRDGAQVLTGGGVVDERLTGRSAGREHAVPVEVHGEPDGDPALRCVGEDLALTRVDVAAPDVAVAKRPDEDLGPQPGRHPLGPEPLRERDDCGVGAGGGLRPGGPVRGPRAARLGIRRLARAGGAEESSEGRERGRGDDAARPGSEASHGSNVAPERLAGKAPREPGRPQRPAPDAVLTG